MRIVADDLASRLGVQAFSDTVLAKALARLPPITATGPWIAGGAVRRTITGEKLDSDFDFFFATKQQADVFAEMLAVKGAVKMAETDKAATYTLPDEGVYLPEMKIQLITFSFFSDPEAVIDAFDFTLSQFAYDGETVFVGPFSLWDVARRRIVIHKVSYGVSTIRRLLKYTAQGYTVCAGALAEILNQVVANPEVIQADAAYID